MKYTCKWRLAIANVVAVMKNIARLLESTPIPLRIYLHVPLSHSSPTNQMEIIRQHNSGGASSCVAAAVDEEGKSAMRRYRLQVHVTLVVHVGNCCWRQEGDDMSVVHSS